MRMSKACNNDQTRLWLLLLRRRYVCYKFTKQKHQQQWLMQLKRVRSATLRQNIDAEEKERVDILRELMAARQLTCNSNPNSFQAFAVFEPKNRQLLTLFLLCLLCNLRWVNISPRKYRRDWWFHRGTDQAARQFRAFSIWAWSR